MTTFNDRDINFMARNSIQKKYYVKHPHENEKVLFPKVYDMNTIKVATRNVSPIPEYNSSRHLTPIKYDSQTYNTNRNLSYT